MFPFAVMALKANKNMDQKIGWRAAFLGDFFWLLKRSYWLVGTRVILVMRPPWMAEGRVTQEQLPR
ncbi:MAG: hypothetical protein CMP20_06515 [Rickettsiales bacterium]|nr:hypothetical protein [Rickettsiales bacterium]